MAAWRSLWPLTPDRFVHIVSPASGMLWCIIFTSPMPTPGSALEITILIGNSRVYILLKFFKCAEDCALFRRLHCIRVGLEWLSHQMESTSPPRRPRLKTLKTMWNENKLNAEQKCTFLNTCIKDAQSGRSIKCSFREYTMRIVHILLWCFDLGKPSKF